MAGGKRSKYERPGFWDGDIKVITDKNQLMPKTADQKGPGQESNPPQSESAAIDRQIAALIGTPILNKPTESGLKSAKTKERHGQCRVLFSQDYMEASLVIEPPVGTGKWPAPEDAFQVISEAQIAFAIDENLIAEIVDKHRTTPVVIARGIPPVNGVDTSLKIFFELRDLHKVYLEGLTEDEHGKVDYKQVKSVQTLSKGDIVAEKILATPGTAGMDVLGKVIPAVCGKEKNLILGKNVAWDEDELQVIATEAGKPLLINNILHVLPEHQVYGDVGYRTGNIYFDGNLIIHGNVENGFKVEADGDVVILGDVEAVTVCAGGKISIKGRVFGADKTRLICHDDFYAKEIDKTAIVCDHNVTIGEAIMHSQVTARNKVVVNRGKGWIVGGYVHAGEFIEAKNIGSKLGTITNLEVNEMINLDLKNAQNETKDYSPKGRIGFHEVMYPGVRITIGPYRFVIEDELKFGILNCTEEGELHLTPYK